MEYFKTKDENQRDIFINLENVLWIEFFDENRSITFYKGKSDAVDISINENEYQETKEKLMKVLTSSISVILD